MKHSIIIPVAFMAASLSSPVLGHQFDSQHLYGGVGLTFNTAGPGNATGVQVFGGYDLNVTINDDIATAVEVGYMDSGDFDGLVGGSIDGAQGIWAALVAETPVNQKIDARVRVGLDFGDDDGLLVGAGLGYHFSQQAELRLDYVVRDHINGLQFNVLFHL